MKRSCLVYLGIFVGVGILGGVALFMTIPPPPPGFFTPVLAKLVPAMVASFAASAFIIMALFGLRDSAERMRDRRHVSENSLSLPADGERVIAFGPIVADGPILESPFTRSRCAAYAYEVRCTTEKSRSDVLCAWGFALTPSHVASPWGTARLMSYTDIEESPSELREPGVRQNAVAYFAATPLTPTGNVAPGLGFDAVKEFHCDQDGSIKGDFGPLPQDFPHQKYRLYEKLLVDGEPITAIGTWDSQLGGVKAKPGNEMLGPVIVRKGPLEKTRRTLLMQAIGGGIAALVLLAIAVTIAMVFVVKAGEIVY